MNKIYELIAACIIAITVMFIIIGAGYVFSTAPPIAWAIVALLVSAASYTYYKKTIDN